MCKRLLVFQRDHRIDACVGERKGSPRKGPQRRDSRWRRPSSPRPGGSAKKFLQKPECGQCYSDSYKSPFILRMNCAPARLRRQVEFEYRLSAIDANDYHNSYCLRITSDGFVSPEV